MSSRFIMLRGLCRGCFAEYSGDPCPFCGRGKNSPPADPSMLPAGTVLEKRYVIGGVIGRGSFGVTYYAYDMRSRSRAAIKEYFPNGAAFRADRRNVLPADGSENAFLTGMERFSREADCVSRFNGNPYIVSVYDRFSANGTSYFVMDFLDGLTLETRVKRFGNLTAGQTAKLADCLAGAMTVVHSFGILHRDISPDNIMLCRDGRFRLIDFGAARRISAERSPQLTVMMKTGFTPAEQYTKNGNFGEWTDIYSAGAVLFYALTGKVPDPPHVRMVDDSRFLSATAEFDPQLRELIRRAAGISESERFQTAVEMNSAVTAMTIKRETAEIPQAHSAEPRKLSKAPFIAAGGAVCAAAVLIIVNAVMQKPAVLPDFPDSAVASPADETGSPAVQTENVAPAEISDYSSAPEASETAAEPPKTESTPEIVNSGALSLNFTGGYAGDFALSGNIPAETLESFNGPVKVVLHFEPNEDENNDLYGFFPCDSDKNNMLPMLTAAAGNSAYPNGWIWLNRDCTQYTFVISREGVESLAGKDFVFRTRGLIIRSVELESGENLEPFNIIEPGENYAVPQYTAENGVPAVKIQLIDGEPIKNDIGGQTTCTIPKSAFDGFTGDVRMTLEFEYDRDSNQNWQLFYVNDSTIRPEPLLASMRLEPIVDDYGRSLISINNDPGVCPDLSLTECTLIIPEETYRDIVGGIYFGAANMLIKSAVLTEVQQ